MFKRKKATEELISAFSHGWTVGGLAGMGLGVAMFRILGPWGVVYLAAVWLFFCGYVLPDRPIWRRRE